MRLLIALLSVACFTQFATPVFAQEPPELEKAAAAYAEKKADDAIALYEQAFQKAQKPVDLTLQVKALNGMGWAYQLKAEDYWRKYQRESTPLRQKQIDSFQRSLDIQTGQADFQKDSQLEAEARMGLAEAASVLGGETNLNTALNSYTTAWKLAIQQNLLRAQADALEGMGQTELKLERPEVSAIHLQLSAAIRILLAQDAAGKPVMEIAPPPTDADSLTTGNEVDAFLMVQRAKQRSLENLLQPEIFQERQELAAKLITNQAQLVEVGDKQDTASKSKRQTLETERKTLILRLLDLHANRTKDPDFARLYNHPELVSSKALRASISNSLPSDTVLVEYFTTSKSAGKCLAFVVKKDAKGLLIQPFVLPVTPTEVQKLATEYRKVCQDQNQMNFWAAGYPLYNQLVEPMAPLLKGAKHLIILPHEAFWGVPFAALPTTKTPGPLTCLLFHYPLAFSHSTIQALAAAPSKPLSSSTGKGQFLVMAVNASSDPALPPLKFAEAEGKSVYGIVTAKFPSSNPQFFPGVKATKETLLQNAPQSRFWHLSCHGVFVQKPALDSYFVLAKSGTVKASRVTADEISKRKLPASMVVLSACDLGRIATTGNGILGMSGAFQQAGVSTQVLSLYPVSDANAPYLMEQFYEGLLTRHLPKDEALQAAARALIVNRRRGPHPYSWGGFFIIGDGGAISR